MIEIPVITDECGCQHPARPIPAHAAAVECDGIVYRVAETAEEAAVLFPPPVAGAADPYSPTEEDA